MKEFYYEQIPAEVQERIKGRSYPEGARISLDELCYVHVLHTGFDGETHKGELIVNRDIAEDTLSIFRKLYEGKYPIEKIELVDNYEADDLLSMAANNSSAFCYRVIWGTDEISNHSYGRAIDINPRYNPYISYHDGIEVIQPDNYIERNEDNPYVIDHESLVYRTFIEHGFEWGGDWTDSKDYHHFQKIR